MEIEHEEVHALSAWMQATPNQGSTVCDSSITYYLDGIPRTGVRAINRRERSLLFLQLAVGQILALALLGAFLEFIYRHQREIAYCGIFAVFGVLSAALYWHLCGRPKLRTLRDGVVTEFCGVNSEGVEKTYVIHSDGKTCFMPWREQARIRPISVGADGLGQTRDLTSYEMAELREIVSRKNAFPIAQLFLASLFAMLTLGRFLHEGTKDGNWLIVLLEFIPVLPFLALSTLGLSERKSLRGDVSVGRIEDGRLVVSGKEWTVNGRPAPWRMKS